MGMLEKALKAPSAYAMKKTTAWEDAVDRIAGALLPADLDVFADELARRPLDYPGGWVGELRELIDKRRQELAEEDIGQILLDRFDFT